MNKSLSHTIFSLEEYNQGSYVIIEGKRRQNFEFFIILEGDVEVQKINPENGSYSSQYLKKGDFFGVISAMTGLPELESVIALSPLKLIAVKREKFGELIQKNPVLAMKIIRSYSLRLRTLDQIQNKNFGGQSKDYSQENSLFQLALSYLELGNKNLASYMLSKYLQLSPNGVYVPQAKIELAKLPKLNFHKHGDYQSNIRNFYPGEIIFCEGEPGNSLYVIMEGEVKIFRNSGNREITMNILNPGQIFGEMALLDKKPRSATAIANTNTKLAIVNKVNFEVTTELNPKLMTKVITVLSERVWILYRKVINRYIKDTHLRFADAFLILAEQAKAKTLPGSYFEYPYSPEEFLNIMGMPQNEIQNLIRFINLHNFMKIDKSKIVCRDLYVLERYVESNKEKENKFR